MLNFRRAINPMVVTVLLYQSVGLAALRGESDTTVVPHDRPAPGQPAIQQHPTFRTGGSALASSSALSSDDESNSEAIRYRNWLRLTAGGGNDAKVGSLARGFSTPQPLSAQAGETDWRNVLRLPLGSSLLIKQRDGAVKGRIVSVTDDGLSMARGKAVVTVSRPQVRQFWLLGESKAGKGAFWGVLIGGIGGAVLYGSICRPAEIDCRVAVPLGGLLFSGIGAGIGAAVGAGMRERTMIYSVP